MKIFHRLPYNGNPSGGIKCHYQLCSLERELGYDAFIVYDTLSQVPSWFKYDVPHLSESQMDAIADKNRDLIVGWEDIEPLLRSGFAKRVSYIQGEVFVNRLNPYQGVDLWISSRYNEESLPQFHARERQFVSPFIDRSVFYLPDESVCPKDIAISVQQRKGGEDIVQNMRHISDITVIPDCSEENFSTYLRRSKIFIAHSFPEGLGLPGLEAMACGCLVVGFTGGGGKDYMRHGSNCFVAPDGDWNQLENLLHVARFLRKEEHQSYITNAVKTVDWYSKSGTREQLKIALAQYE